jgi:hypothetical protein
MRWSRIVCLGLALGACRADPKPQSVVEKATFGVLYGGEIQERENIPFELDRRRLTLLLRLDFRRPLPRETRVTWSVERPGRDQRPGQDARGRRKAARITRMDEVRVPAGRSRFEQVILLSPGDPLGSWRLRAEVDGQTVLERPFSVYDPALGDGGAEDGGRTRP